MGDFFGKAFSRLFILYGQWSPSKYFVLAFDLMMAVVMFLLVHFGSMSGDYCFLNVFSVFVLFLVSFLLVHTYDGLIRHTGFSDIIRIFGACLLCFGLFLLTRFLLECFSPDYIAILPTVFEMSLLCSVMAVSIVIVRLLIKFVYFVGKTHGGIEKKVVVIYGAGSLGSLTKNVLRSDGEVQYRIPFFIDDDYSKYGKGVDGTSVFPVEEGLTEESIRKYHVDTLVLAMPNISADKKRAVIDEGVRLGLNVLSVPSYKAWMNGTFSANQLKTLKVEDLLDREVVVLKGEEVNNMLSNQVVLVTGASGSIGQEIVRQVLKSDVKTVIALDQAETQIFDFEFSVKRENPEVIVSNKLKFVVADVRDEVRMRYVFDKYRPAVVFHAAAYKHVPLMEENPYEAVRVNVFGTKIVADLSVEFNVKKFVMVSTDKAVNPTNVMGATKRVAEMYVQSLTNVPVSFITTRFGNVLGSSGSVIPLFSKQIEEGGPVTITHKDIIRYFMTIPEACSLVLEAASIGESGEIYIFDMGNPVKIYDLAVSMIRLSNAKNIKIKEIGLRPGEKLYEEVLYDKETTLPTSHPKIKRAKIRPCEFSKFVSDMNELESLMASCDDIAIVAKLKEMVPEFISNNSRFSILDKNEESVHV